MIPARVPENAAPRRIPREVAVVWLLALAWVIAVAVTYARLPASELYNVSGSGVRGGLSRALLELNFPVGAMALAVLAVVAGHLPRRARLVALVAALCSAVFMVPGVLEQSDLDARWINAVPAVGVALALACSLSARGPTSTRPRSVTRADRLRLALLAPLVLLASPWIAAHLGFYLDGVPVLGWIFQTGEIVTVEGETRPAVHLGVHHGLQGLLLVVTALLLWRLLSGDRGVATQATALWLALLLAYGLGNVANDAWFEQITARGWTSYAIPSILEPSFNWLWAGVLVAALAIWLAWRRRSMRLAGIEPATLRSGGARSIP
jgi:hypothetical protein